VTDPVGFYTQEDFWSVPDEPGNPGTQQPPFYQYAQFPDQSKPNFNLTSPLNSQRAPKLAAFAYVSSDPADYGKIRVLQLPQGVTINGPVQAKSTIESNAVVSSALSLLRQGGSQTISGNLLTLPVSGGLIYVQPYYVQATGDQGYPTLQDIAVAYGDNIGFDKTLSGALTKLFGAGAAGSATQSGNGGGGTNTGNNGGGPAVTPQVQALVKQASDAFAKGQKDFGKGDFVAYAQDQKVLQDALNGLVVAGKAKATPTQAPSASPTGTTTTTPKTSTSGKPSTTPTPSATP
jgi:uncharacterized membrane protein (UPF0182 family)